METDMKFETATKSLIAGASLLALAGGATAGDQRHTAVMMPQTLRMER